jgi:hypothetical protein
VILVTQTRPDALARLDVLIGGWSLEARFPGPEPAAGPSDEAGGQAGGGPVVRSWFEWALDRQFLLQRTEVPIPDAPDSLAIVAAGPRAGGYTQHYYDSRGVVRLYAMTFDGGVWTLTREAPDFSPLDFGQRFTGMFSADGNTITGAWEKRFDGGEWEHDFALIYHRDT